MFRFFLLLLTIVLADIIPPYDSRIRYFGRFDKTNPDMFEFDWSAVGMSITFTGSSIGILLTDVGNQYDVVIDQTQKLLNTTSTTVPHLYPLATFRQAGQHTVQLLKRTEALFGAVSFAGFFVDHPAAPRTDPLLVSHRSLPVPLFPETPKARFEFLGDSLSCGYGNLGKWPCHFSADTEDAMLSFPYLVAQHFGGLANVQCWSGKGVVRNYGSPNTTSPDPFPMFYPRTVANIPTSAQFDPASYQADVVVIVLGSNDFSTKPQPSEDVFAAGYHALLTKVRAYHPRASIFIGTGVTSSDPLAIVQRIAAKEKVVFVDLSKTVGSDEFGCDYHPNTVADKKIAQRLIDAISKAKVL